MTNTYDMRPEEVITFEVVKSHETDKQNGHYRLHHPSFKEPVGYHKPVGFALAMEHVLYSLPQELSKLYIKAKDAVAREALKHELPVPELSLEGRTIVLLD